MSVITKKIECAPQTLEQIIALHRSASKQLGFFPRGAFEDHARAGRILLALNMRDEVLGYLLYRVAKERATIVHLCTALRARGQGVGRSLVEHLKSETKTLAGIGLRCRQDYDSKHVWAKFGFTALHRKAGRSQDGHELTFWWFDHGHPDLFSFAASNDDRRQQVVVDANVFFDLQDCENRDSEDSKALLADWIQASIELCVTKEIYNEIDRAGDPQLRVRSKAAVTGYPLLKSDDARFQQVCEELKPLFPQDAVLRDESDLRQIAYAIAGDAAYVVTRDERLADRCEPLYERFGVRVLHPAELISDLDVIEREAQYRPAWIEGSRLRSRAVQGEDVEALTTAFRNKTKEKSGDFRKEILHCLSRPREVETKLVSDSGQQPVLLGVLNRGREDVLNVTTLRTAEHLLAATLVRNFLRTTLQAATREGRRLVFIADPNSGGFVQEALEEFGFASVANGWAKITVRTVGGFNKLREAVDAAANLTSCETLVEAARRTLTEAEQSRTTEAVAAIESRFWPAKIAGSNLPTFIVSIRAEWARHFFDDDLAAQFLFGTRDELLLGIEGVYYCSAHHRYLTAPARILWYVSKGSDGAGSMSIKACSRLEEVVIGKPKEVFKRFRRLGIFQWKDVFHVAKNDLSHDILAFRFSMTERFLIPFPLDQLEAMNIRQPLLAPRRISDAQFTKIYSYGCQIS